MNDNTTYDDDAAVTAAYEILEARAKQITEARDSQPQRLAEARDAADQARGWALIEEPFDGQVDTITSADGSTTLAVPNMVAKELWGARLAFDLLDAGEDMDQIDAITTRLFTTVNGDTGLAFLIAAAALSTIAGTIVPQLMAEIETTGSNYDARVLLAEARTKAWNGRVSELRDKETEVSE